MGSETFHHRRQHGRRSFDESTVEYHARGLVKKDDLTVTLRAHQAAVDAAKSQHQQRQRQREEAEKFRKRN